MQRNRRAVAKGSCARRVAARWSNHTSATGHTFTLSLANCPRLSLSHFWPSLGAMEKTTCNKRRNVQEMTAYTILSLFLSLHLSVQITTYHYRCLYICTLALYSTPRESQGEINGATCKKWRRTFMASRSERASYSAGVYTRARTPISSLPPSSMGR